jgi:hypothetical protein
MIATSAPCYVGGANRTNGDKPMKVNPQAAMLGDSVASQALMRVLIDAVASIFDNPMQAREAMKGYAIEIIDEVALPDASVEIEEETRFHAKNVVKMLLSHEQRGEAVRGKD